MIYENIRVEKEENVGIISLNRPGALNALSSGLMTELLNALNEFEGDNEIRCIVITGGDRIFSAGADIKEMSNWTAQTATKQDNLARFDQLKKFRKPLIAAVSGIALGGGLELAMACDLIVASESARFGQPEINIGVFPGAGGTQRLTRAIGKYRSMDMILTGSQLTAKEALDRGLVSRVVPNEMYLLEAMRLAKEIGAKSPLAVSLAKECVQEADEMTLSEGLAFERKYFYMMVSSEDKQEGMKAFLEKRKAVFQGR